MAQPSEVVYSAKTGRYIWADSKKFVSRAVISNLLDQEQVRLGTQLRAHTRLLAKNQITLPEWQTRMAIDLRDSHLRMGLLGSGGKSQIGSRQYGAIGYQLRQQYNYLDGFAHAIAKGNVSPKQALNRASQYADSIRLTFHRTEQITRGAEGFDEAMRMLDPQARHCSDCIAHSTNGKWVRASAVTIPGTNCKCGQHCRCKIVYRKRKVNLSQPGILAA